MKFQVISLLYLLIQTAKAEDGSSAAPSSVVLPSAAPSSFVVETSAAPSSSVMESSAAPSTVIPPSNIPSPSPTVLEVQAQQGSMTPVTSTPFATAEGQNMTAECSAYSACSGLIDDCCPTVDDVFLYCCFEAETPDGGSEYEKEFTLIDSASGPDVEQAEYFESTSTYFNPGTSPDGATPVISYVRDPNELYDMIYFKTAAITNANDYVSGEKKFYIDLYSTAPPCTQIILQLDSLPSALPDNYPTGRHSRYFAATTVQNAWERLEFDFLDRPDAALGDDVVDAFVLLFSPGLDRADPYFFRNLDSTKRGCTTDCEQHAPKSCSALFTGEAGLCEDGIDNDNDGLTDCEDSECTADPACATAIQTAYANVESQVRAGEEASSGTPTWYLGLYNKAWMLLLVALAL